MCQNKINLINGNNLPYSVDMPKIVILSSNINPIALDHIFQNTGLNFTPKYNNWYEAIPTNANQIVSLFLTYNFKTKYFNNWNYENTIMLKFDHHVGFDVDSICFNCVKHNNINTNGLKDGDYLAC